MSPPTGAASVVTTKSLVPPSTVFPSSAIVTVEVGNATFTTKLLLSDAPPSETVNSNPPLKTEFPASKVTRLLLTSSWVKLSPFPTSAPPLRRVPPAGTLTTV